MNNPSLLRLLASYFGTDVMPEYFCHGQVGSIYKVSIDQKAYIAKTGDAKKLGVEAKMLRDLSAFGIATPKVIALLDGALVMEYIEQTAYLSAQKEHLAAKLLAEMHAIKASAFGYDYDTLIGPFWQPNVKAHTFASFYLNRRIVPMLKHCIDKGFLSSDEGKGIEAIVCRCQKILEGESIAPSLLHGDVWSGNILFAKEGARLIDPALYFGDKEMELAFIDLFSTLGETFYAHYTKHHSLSKVYATFKRPLYQLYPLLVHVAIYGKSYLAPLHERVRVLERAC